MIKYIWVIPILPLLSFIAVLFFGKRLPGKGSYVAISAVSLSFLYSLIVLAQVVGGKTLEFNYTWLTVGRNSLNVGVIVDPLTSVMLIVVTSVALMVQIYSLGYMEGDPRFSWYYAALSLFTAAMLSLVIANNYLQLYISWELVGLCSYLLIGFWFEKKSASDAGKKAFITTRIGDVGFFLGIVTLFVVAGTFNFTSLSHMIEAGKFSPALLATIAILLFCGAAGKSAQVPLHVWLPDAMEGPTPVSALIHAATMVAAGVYLVARSFFIFEAALPSAFSVVAIIGTITALMAATIALTMSDIKKILAYSTISQLGFMMVALGVGGYVAGVFHLMTHAFFKALLFLGAGSIIHGTGTQNIYDMGGLSKKMRITFITFLVASLSIAGIFPLSGFWSKDEILADAFKGGHYLIFGILLFTAFLTAFYMFRLCFLVFFGSPRNHNIHAHESPPSMTYPLIILAIPAALAGLLGSPFLGSVFVSFLEGGHAEVHLNYLLMGASLLVGLLGIGTAWAIYYKGLLSEESIKKRFSFLYHVLENKYYFDEIYHAVFVRPVVGLGLVLNRFDWGVVDGVARGASIVVLRTSGRAAQLDSSVDWVGDFIARFFVIGGKIAVWFDRKVIDGLVHALGGGTVVASQETEVFESKVVDRLVNGVGALVKRTSHKLRAIHTGNLLNYAIYVFIAELAAIIIALLIAWFTR